MALGIQTLIFIHAFLGGISLLSGLVSLLAQKGRRIHKTSGNVFFYSMTLTGLTAMLIAVLPGHESSFLFSIGIFSLYLTLSGKRALRLKSKAASWPDRIISIGMIVTGLLMILLPIVLTNSLNIVLSIFALVGIIFSIRDLTLFRNAEVLRREYLKMHIGKMMGAYISATTAFVVVNHLIPGLAGWLLPGVIGTGLIAYWIRRVGRVSVSRINSKV